MAFIYHDGVNPPTTISGNPVLESLDGTERASLLVITHASWSPERRAEFGIYEAVDDPEPVYDPQTEKLVRDSEPTNNGNGSFSFGWSVVPLSQPELQSLIDQEDREAVKNDPQVLALLKARPDQINRYVDNNVTNLASAKETIKVLARAVSILAQSLLR